MRTTCQAQLRTTQAVSECFGNAAAHRRRYRLRDITTSRTAPRQRDISLIFSTGLGQPPPSCHHIDRESHSKEEAS